MVGIKLIAVGSKESGEEKVTTCSSFWEWSKLVRGHGNRGWFLKMRERCYVDGDFGGGG